MHRLKEINQEMSKLKSELFGKFKGQSAWDEVKEKLMGNGRPSLKEPKTPTRQHLDDADL